MEVSVIIVSYNTREKTCRCIESVVEKTEGLDYEVIVSDNGSLDGTISAISEKFPDVILIKNEKNIGFARANNIALKIAKGRYIFYLNSDTFLLNNAIKMLWEYFENSDERTTIGAIGGQLFSCDGRPLHSGGELPTYEFYCRAQFKIVYRSLIKAIAKMTNLSGVLERIVEKKGAGYVKEYYGEVGYVIGADLFLRNDANAYFNEDYFMYCEETELEYHMEQEGLRRIIIEGPRIVHDQNRGFMTNVFSVADALEESSRLLYAHNIFHRKGYVLKTLVWINGFNPYVSSARKKAEKIRSVAK